MKFKLFVSFLLLMAFTMNVTAQSQEAQLSLEEVMAKALGTNEMVLQAKEDLQYAKLLRKAAFSAFIPNASLNGGFVRNDKELKFSLGEGMDITFQNLYDWSYNVVVSSPLYKGGFMLISVKKTAYNIGISESMLSKTQLDLMFQVSAAYAQVEKADRMIAIKKNNLELAQKQLIHAKLLFDAGETVRSSISRAVAQVAMAEGEVLTAENDLSKTRQDLALLVDLPAQYSLMDLPVATLPDGDLESYVQTAMRSRLEIETLNQQMSFNEVEIVKATSSRLPQIDWNAMYVKQRSGFPVNSFWKVNLNATWKLYDSGASAVRKAQQESIQRKMELNMAMLRRQIRNDVTKAYLDYTSVIKAKETVAKQLASISLAYQDIETFYKVGEVTDLDVENMRKQLVDAEVMQTNLLTDEKLTLFRLRHSLGLPAVDIK